MDNYTEFGDYIVPANANLINAPTTQPARLEVKPYTSTAILQLFIAYIAPPRVFMRRRTAGGAWSDWYEFQFVS